MKPPRKESAIERRLRELDAQSSALQSDIKTLNRSIRKNGPADPGGRVAARPPPPPARGEQPSRLNPNYAASVGSGTTTSISITNQEPETAGAGETETNLFGLTGAEELPVPRAPDVFPTTISETAAPAPRYRRVAAPAKPAKLANYLASGSFGSNVPLSHERKAQRLRAMIALTAVATFAYIIYCSVFR